MVYSGDQCDQGIWVLEGVAGYLTRKVDQWLIINEKEGHSYEFGCLQICKQYQAVEQFCVGKRYRLLAFL